MCCHTEVQLNFGTSSAPSAKTPASVEHYKGMFGTPLLPNDEKLECL